MIDIYTCCTFSGENFYPSKLEEALNIIFDKKNYPNEMGKVRKIPYGNGVLIYSNESCFPDSEYLEKILFIKEASKDFCIDDIVLHITIGHDKEEFSFEISSQLLKSISNLGIILTITTYESD